MSNQQKESLGPHGECYCTECHTPPTEGSKEHDKYTCPDCMDYVNESNAETTRNTGTTESSSSDFLGGTLAEPIPTIERDLTAEELTEIATTNIPLPSPTEPTEREGWEEEYDENFDDAVFADGSDAARLIKPFISRTLHRERERVVEILEGMKKPWPDGYPREGVFCLADGFNHALREAIKRITSSPN